MAKKTQNNAAMFGARSFKELLVASTKRGDILFALGIILMLVILILPMPAWLLDIALALSITMACIVLMTAIFIEKPTEFSAFPLVLLITTMYRLSLNLASTRLILSRGYLGPDAAGEVIEAFGGLSSVLSSLPFWSSSTSWSLPKVPAVLPKLPRVLPWMPCPASRWPSMPTCLPD